MQRIIHSMTGLSLARLRLLVLISSAGLLLLLATQCRQPQAPAPTQATFAFVGNFRGFQRPCGCNSEQYGGLLRLGTAMAKANAVFSGSAAGDPPAKEAEASAAQENTTAAGHPPPVQDLQDLLPDAQGGAMAEASKPHAAVIQPPDGITLPQPLWFIDCGNFAWSELPFPPLRAQTHLNALAAAGCKAVVIGSSELHLAKEHAAESLAGSPVPLLSCNVLDRTGKIKLEPYLELATGWYVVGVSSWQPAVDDPPADAWFEISEPVAAVQAVLKRLPSDAHVLLVALNHSAEVVRQLGQLPVVGIVGYQPEAGQTWPAELAPIYPGPPGKASELKFISFNATANPIQATAWEVPLGSEWSDDTKMQALIRAEREAQRQMLGQGLGRAKPGGWKDIEWGSSEQFLPQAGAGEEDPAAAAAGPPQYVGAKACIDCHREAYRVWITSKHKHAYETLQHKGEHDSLDCLKCHTVGLLEPTGFDPLNPLDLVAGVGCESCHGPGSTHVAVMEAAKKAGKDQPGAMPQDQLAITAGNVDNCVKCHDPYNSPKFQKDWWEDIKHGLDP